MSRVTIWHRRGCGPCAAVIRDLVPLMRDEGIPVRLADIHDHPCEARAERVDYLPTIVYEDGGRRLVCRGYPPREFLDEIFDD